MSKSSDVIDLHEYYYHRPGFTYLTTQSRIKICEPYFSAINNHPDRAEGLYKPSTAQSHSEELILPLKSLVSLAITWPSAIRRGKKGITTNCRYA